MPFAAAEVKNLARAIAATTTLLDRKFTPEAIVSRMNDYNIVYNNIYLATHAASIVGQTEDSFILFGDRPVVTLPELAT